VGTVYLAYSDLLNGNGNTTTCALPHPCTTTESDKAYHSLRKLVTYPNPANQQTTLTFDNPKNKNLTLILYDLQGRSVQTTPNITSDQIEIDRKNLPSGLYFIHLQNESEVLGIGKLILQ
jgi:hypothetical protein